MLWVIAASVVAGVAAILLLWTAPTWLSRILGGLDRLLVRLGVGTYAAGFITWVENRAAERRARRRNRKGREAVESVDRPGTN